MLVLHCVCSSHSTDLSTHLHPAQPVSVPRRALWPHSTRQIYTSQILNTPRAFCHATPTAMHTKAEYTGNRQASTPTTTARKKKTNEKREFQHKNEKRKRREKRTQWGIERLETQQCCCGTLYYTYKICMFLLLSASTNLTSLTPVRVSTPPLISSDSRESQAISLTSGGTSMVMSPPRSAGKTR